jgi:hypothetical protein
MEYLNIVHKRHNEWLAIVKSFGYSQYPEDIVQDMYIQLTKEIPTRSLEDKRVNPKYSGFTAEERAVDSEGNVNSTYIWLMLRKCYSNAYKKESKIPTTNVGEGFEFIVDSKDTDREIGFDNYRTKLEKEIDSWHHYDSMLFMTYLEGKEDKSTSLRKLAKDTKIPLSSIVNTLTNCKERLRENVGEDYLDYINGNYELI